MARGEVDSHVPSRRADDSIATHEPLGPGPAPLRRYWWFLPLAIYAVTRLINAAMFSVASRSAISIGDFVASGHDHFATRAGSAPPGYLASVSGWDGQWYWEIAANGYPTELPKDAAGAVAENPWAFFPLYPYLVRVVMMVLHLDFPVAATAVSLVFGAISMLLLYRIVEMRHGHLGGVLAVLGLSTFMCAPALQMAYAEALALALILACMWCVLGGRYVTAAAFLLLLALTRGVTAPMAPALLLYAIHRRRRGQLSRREVLQLGALAGWSGALTFLWFLIAGAATGRLDAYVLTQKAWNPELTVIPVARFVQRNIDLPGGKAGAVTIALVWACFLIWFMTKGQREVLLALWTGSYVAYLLAVTDWNWSNVRYYLLALPVLWPLVERARGERSPVPRVAVAGAVALIGTLTQWWYIRYCVTISPELVQVP